ncbi:MAG: zinc ribbon domain-containing protein [Polyangiaceae bacterium]|nr:zinc ribbon domain-containing protein [Polyangiaceae bacterium]
MSAKRPTPMATAVAAPPKPERTLTERQITYLWLGGAAAVLLLGIGAGAVFGPQMTALVLAGGTLAAAIAVFWGSIRALFGEVPLSGEEAFALAAPTAEEERKRAVLRGIKDLEFERGVGKISDEDYRVLMDQYRGEAKRLLRLIDEQARPDRERVQKVIDAHLRNAGLADAATDARIEDEAADAFGAAPPPEGDDRPARPRAEPATTTSRRAAKRQRRLERQRAAAGAEPDEASDAAAPRCAACQAENDADARFCKRCGGALGAGDRAVAAEEPSEP